MHSQRINEALTNTWIKTTDDGEVDCTHCDCMAGLDEVCLHVGAILFYVEAVRRNKSCTDVPCSWSMPSSVDKIPYARIADIDFMAPKSIILQMKRGAHLNNDCHMLSKADAMEIERPCSSKDSDNTTVPSTFNINKIPSTEDQKALFFKEIASHKPCCLFLLPPYSDSYVPNAEGISSSVPPLTTLYTPQNEELTYTELLHLCENYEFDLSQDQLCDIAKATVGQHECDEWFAQRAGRITASKMKAAYHTDPAFPSISLIKQICYPHWFRFSSEATKWGCDHESIAIGLYAEDMVKQHSGFRSGLCIHKEYQFLAATPDGITQCDCCGNGVVEVKCPYCKKDSNPDTADCLVNGSLKKDHQYYYQIQLQMSVCNVEHVDFVICTFPNDVPVITIERISPDADFLEKSIVEAGHFYTVAILPELFAKWYTRSIVNPATAVVDHPSTYNYCYCKRELGGEMVCCDNDECPDGQWFHLSCLKLKKAPRVKKWYCPHCRRTQ